MTVPPDASENRRGGLRFRRLAWPDIPWEQLDAAPDRCVSQTRGWLEFVAASQEGEPVVARLYRNGSPVGWFSGVLVRRWGVKVLGSPLVGWTTPYMGFNLTPGVRRRDALAALPDFAWRLGCRHLEVVDRLATQADAGGLGYVQRPFKTYLTDLAQSEESLFGAMSSARRRAYRKSQKVGVTVEEAEPEGFASEYYRQLVDVFAKQDLRPSYGQRRVERLIEFLHPSGRLLLLRARDPEGLSIATGIFPGHADFSYFWGNASLRSHQNLRPNEALHWHAMLTWKARGARWHDWGGGGHYKKKYGVEPLVVPRLYKSTPRLLQTARSLAEDGYRHLRRTNSRLRRRIRGR